MHIKKRQIPEALDKACHLFQQGALHESKVILTAIIKADQRQPDALHLLGLISAKFGEIIRAAELLKQVVKLASHVAEYHNSLGVVLRKQGRLSDAERSYRRCLKLEPDHVEALDNLATLLRHAKRPVEAECYCRKALAIKPEAPLLLANLAGTLVEQGRVAEPRRLFDQLIKHKDRKVQMAGLNGLMGVARSTGEVAVYLNFHLQMLQLVPDYCLGDYLFYLNYLDTIDQKDLGHQHCKLATRLQAAGPLYSTDHFSYKIDKSPLRVGYVSPDLTLGPVGTLFEPVVRQHDPKKVYSVVYDVHMEDEEPLEGIKRNCSLWRDCRGMPDETLLSLIRSDEIDILVDLAGYCGNRLSVFAARAAPVQVSWLGYFNTTGLAQMDWIISDFFSTPQGEEQYYSERVWRMPYFRFPVVPKGNSCHIRRKRHPGEVVFVSNNNLLKLTEPVLIAWGRILNQLPASRLVVRWKTLASDELRQNFRERFQSVGGNLEQLLLPEPISEHEAFVASYQEVDIMLDSFPFGGGITSIDALVMGVPVITLPSDRMAGQQTRAFLELCGHPELVASSWDQYVQIAVELANDQQRLQNLHATLREDLLCSPLCDAKRFTHDLEIAYYAMWQNRCKKGCPANNTNECSFRKDDEANVAKN